MIFTLSEPKKTDNAVVDGIMMWIGVAIMLVVFLPVISGVIAASPNITSDSPLNATQVSMATMISSSYGLLLVTLIILAAVIILGVIAYLRQR